MPTCRTETCCPPVSSYKADADARATVPDGECPLAQVAIFPPDGSYVILPTFVVLSCNVAGATIYYTTDGSEPTEESTAYVAPFQVSSSATTVKALAILSGCDPGPVASAQYPVIDGSSWQFAYLCDTGDKVGVFGEFAANGQANDYQFALVFTLDDDTEILDITILQTDETGYWNSGQAWSTKEYIYPWPNPAMPFHVYPLVLIDESGPTQLFTSYQTTLGTIAVDTYEWRMWGQPFTTLNGFFLCQITLGDGTLIRRLIEATCTPPPPPCSNPSAPTLAADCDPKITVTATMDDDWRLYRRSGGGDWVEVSSGSAGAVSFEDEDVERCVTYDYYIERLCDGDYYQSSTASVLVPCACVIELLADVDNVCPGDAVEISFSAMNCVGEISWGTDGEGGAFTGTGELEGSITVNPSVTTTYTFRGSSVSCGDFYATVTVTVVACPPPETCDPELYADTYQFNGDAAEMTAEFDDVTCFNPMATLNPAFGLAGVLTKDDFLPCHWFGQLEADPPGGSPVGFAIVMDLSAGQWVLQLTGWTGVKTTGLTPVGTYTKTSGCLTMGSFTIS